MKREIGAVLAGIVVGTILNMGIILLNTFVLFPGPADLDFSNAEQMAAYLSTLPVAALLVAVTAHLIQAFAGGWVAARLAADPMRAAMTVALLSLAGGLINLVNLDAPAWMWVEMPLYLLAGNFAGRLEQARRGAPSPTAS